MGTTVNKANSRKGDIINVQIYVHVYNKDNEALSVCRACYSVPQDAMLTWRADVCGTHWRI